MAKGRTISANFLTDFDKQVVDICSEIADILIESISDDEQKKEFKNDFAKLSKKTRDAGAGRGGGKLQRDALCTRGIQGNAPFSNRNFRWHPLIAAQSEISFAKPIERIEIDGNTLNFVIKDEQGNEQIYPSELVYQLPERYVVLPEHWFPHIPILQNWGDVEWTQNSCIITAYEACNWFDAVEAYAVLGISIVVGFYNVNFEIIYNKVVEILKNQNIDNRINLPSTLFPSELHNIINCPLCITPIVNNPANLSDRERELRWKPEWTGNKRGEGEDGSTQIMHVEPLLETEIRHTAKNVRYAHKNCLIKHNHDNWIDYNENF